MKVFYLQKVDKITIISPSKIYIKNLGESLKALKNWDKDSFTRVNKCLKFIFISPNNKKYNHTLVDDKAWISGYDIFEGDYDMPYIASLLIHESHHVAQYLSGHEYFGEKAETAAYKEQRKFLKKIKYDYAVQWLDKQYSNKWWKAMDKSVKGKTVADKLFSDFTGGKLAIKKLTV